MKKKTIALALVLVMVFGATFGGTFAYLTSQDTVTNTFTVGNVKITMDEAKVNLYGEPVDNNGKTESEVTTGWTAADRVKANECKLLPGHTYTKDPTIYVDAKSEDAWLFVKVENGISAIEATGNTTIANQMAANWTLVPGTTNIYAYKEKVSANSNVKVFDSFTVSGDAKNNAPENAADRIPGVQYIEDYATVQIVVTAYAIQADGFTTAAAAWTAAGLN